MDRWSSVTIMICLAGWAPGSAAQATSDADRSGPRPLLPVEQEIALARSAAPKNVSAHASVLVFNGSGFERAVEGDNGVTCAVLRSWPRSLEPHCFDAEASITILPMLLREAELQIQGLQPDQIEADRRDGIRVGKYRLPARPALTYMLSAGQVLYADDGRAVGRWKPHLMIYFPYLTNLDLGLDSTGRVGRLVLFDEREALSTLVIIQDDFVTPDPPATSP